MAHHNQEPHQVLANEVASLVNRSAFKFDPEELKEEIRKINLNMLSGDQDSFREAVGNWVRSRKNCVDLLWSPSACLPDQGSEEGQYLMVNKEFYLN